MNLYTNYILLLFSLFLVLIFFSCASGQTEEVNYLIDTDNDHAVLVFTKTAGWRHDSIEAGVEAVEKLGNEHSFNVTHTENSDYFTEENLAKYNAIIFLNTTLTVFEDHHREAFQNYIQNGGGFVGIHSASDTEYDWQWYGDLVGAYFTSHPNNPNVRNAVIDVLSHAHPATSHLPSEWEREDEWYNFGYINDQTNVLMKLDTDSYEGSEHPGNHPVAWYHEYDGGRAFYTALGHTKESFSEENFLNHILGGIRYASGIE